MTRYLVLATFTDQGIRTVKDTTKRAAAVREMGAQLGVQVKDIYWTLGAYDVVLVAEASDDAAMTAFGMSIGAQGNVRTQTLRAFNADEMQGILGKVR
ncbi:Glutamine synthetase and cystathionine beta-lyase binding protein [Cupriavidus yeoncheonensis]|uniref:Glutamine synthetase and cystathionine beta-lyase binding protein n=1 Tax=Cupriavidus yeoncheonensis TaxID=1462994 RepID=A0A916ITA5_9BURK|nr:GYD domain-containing protein [Cupriavidus yeoncheonensis]CAG2135579.1 Glutamine synthetase and cystathionine beta-lyase binding protein [Cupriavidus yeoncheonensis]